MEQSPPPAFPVVLMVSPTGARRTKADHPALPMTAPEIARAAAESAEAGANAIHVHVRERDGRHSLDAAAYREAFAAIEREVGPNRLLIQATSEAFGIYEPAQQIAAMRELRPRAVSVALREVLPSIGHEGPAADFFSWLRTENIGTQCIVYNVEELKAFYQLRGRGVIPGDRVTLMLVLGRYTTGAISKPIDLLPYLQALDPLQPASLDDVRLWRERGGVRSCGGRAGRRHAGGLRKQSATRGWRRRAESRGTGGAGRRRRAADGAAIGDV